MRGQWIRWVSFGVLGLLNQAAVAGEWGSSGGEFLRDSLNPWFVKNTPRISYCIAVDEQGFSASPARVTELVEMAISYWQNEFADEGLLGLGQKSFVRTSSGCVGTEDLRLQFGYETLESWQLQEFRKQKADPQQYVGVAVRTEYDRERLKGRGFIFIGSDRGSHPYNWGHGVARNLWQHDGVLYRVLLHEIGHVFGAPHYPETFMAADFPDKVLRHFEQFRLIQDIGPFFRPRSRHRLCGEDLFDFAWFVVPPRWAECIEFEITPDHDRFSIHLTTRTGERIGTGEGRVSQARLSVRDFPVKVVFPREQRVFPALPGEISWKGPGRVAGDLYLELPNQPGFAATGLHLEISPSYVRVNGVRDGLISPLGEKRYSN